MYDELKEELREERTARTKLQGQIDHMESKNQEKDAQWKSDLKHVTDSCMARTVALEERMKRKRPELQSKIIMQIIRSFFIVWCRVLVCIFNHMKCK